MKYHLITKNLESSILKDIKIKAESNTNQQQIELNIEYIDFNEKSLYQLVLLFHDIKKYLEKNNLSFEILNNYFKSINFKALLIGFNKIYLKNNNSNNIKALLSNLLELANYSNPDNLFLPYCGLDLSELISRQELEKCFFKFFVFNGDIKDF